MATFCAFMAALFSYKEKVMQGAFFFERGTCLSFCLSFLSSLGFGLACLTLWVTAALQKTCPECAINAQVNSQQNAYDLLNRTKKMATFCASMAMIFPYKDKVMQGAFFFEPTRHLPMIY